MKLKDAIEGYLLFKASRASPETIKTDRVVLNQFADWVNNRDITAITGEDVRAYLDYQENERGLSRYTTKRHYASISAMYSWLTAPSVKLAENNPTDMVPAPKPPEKKPKAVDQDTVEGLVSSCKGSRNPRRDKAMVL
ncbi:MAG: site-specific integrase, partial [Chloroflexi bacterium]|nr:site-specific integrase [Chloroflexota bacterium]